ncbi:MAG: biotin--[acetyl-CoA-carboxylase] ligase [Euryarchaeota archaeon]|nr:biotin--[acetyl-CoA-carboxylase] ligase [Euryarchaeota archaeon]
MDSISGMSSTMLAMVDPMAPQPMSASLTMAAKSEKGVLKRCSAGGNLLIRRATWALVDDRRGLGSRLLMVEVLESTNSVLKEMAEAGEPEGTVVVAEEQRAGRGRLGRGWASPRGGLWFSVLLRPEVPPAEAPSLTLMAGVAVAQALKAQLGLDARLKWPNDVLVRGKKLCGLLAESRSDGRLEYVILGIGINANFLLSALPEELRRTAITVREILQRPVDRLALMRAIIKELDAGYKAFRDGGIAPFLERWRELSETLDRAVRVETATGIVQGVAEDIDATGALRVRTPNGPVTVGSGDCVHLD